MTEQKEKAISVTGPYIYPVKSLAGISLTEAEVGTRGFKYDRLWLIVDAENHFLTQREIPRMSLIKTHIDETKNVLQMVLPDQTVLSVPLSPSAKESADTINVKVWDDEARATLESSETNQALSQFLQCNARLVRMADDHRRIVDQDYAPGDHNIVSFADGFPFLFISEESLDDLNNRLEYPLPMNRFRPNITTCGGGPFSEDQWKSIKINDIKFDLVKPCARCVITTIDQEAGVAEKEPLRTLANFRKQNGKIMFGQNAIFQGQGTLKVGDIVKVQS